MHFLDWRNWISSWLWRSLNAYGRIKYRHLLPVYRFFGAFGSREKPAGTRNPSRTLRRAQAIADLLHRGDAHSYSRQLQQVIQRVRNSNGAVIFLPSVGWEIPNTQRCHHLAREFARQGYVSIFDSTNTYDDVSGFREIEPNLFLFRADESLLHKIPDPILWAVTYNFDRKDAYPRAPLTVYDWIDDFEVFPYDRDFLESNHARALKEATVIASVAHRLHEQAWAVRKDALYLPNGTDYGHFAAESVAVPEGPDIAAIQKEGKPVAGYYGAMAEWFDYELLERTARLRPDWNFLLIGPVYDSSLRERGKSMLELPNVRWIGPCRYETLPAYLRLFDVATIPFVINDITLATSPLKLYEYFAGGKPVVTTPMPECQQFTEVLIARDPQEFALALDQGRERGNDEQFQAHLHELGRINSWAARVETIVSYLKMKS